DPTFQQRFLNKLERAYDAIRHDTEGDVRQELEFFQPYASPSPAGVGPRDEATRRIETPGPLAAGCRVASNTCGGCKVGGHKMKHAGRPSKVRRLRQLRHQWQPQR